MVATHNNTKSMGHSKSSLEREHYSITSILQEARKISDKHSNSIPKRTKKKKKDGIKPNLGRRKEIIKIRAEINDIETKKHKISMKPRTGSLKKLTRLTNLALARWLGCVKCCLVHQKVAGFISCQGIYLGSGFDP